jgi:serine/threonine protein kinase
MRVDRPKRKPSFGPPTPLAVGSRLGDYEVRGVLGSGTYGIVYRVFDPEAGDELAVREYLPRHLAVRDGATAVVVRSPDEAEAYGLGLRFFTNEAKLLSKVEHTSLIKVYGGWEENGTAYLAMELFHGRNLKESMQARWKSPSDSSLRSMMSALLGALEVLHKGGVQHRDIAPQNVLLGPNGKTVLLDMDSPRRVASARGDTGPIGPRDGFAPIELYGTDGKLRRGPWTDFYSLGATLYYMVGAKPPPTAGQRTPGDRPALQLHKADGRQSLELLGLLDWMLAVQPADRPQSVAEVRAVLDGGPLPEAYAPKAREKLAATLRRRRRWLWGSLLLLLVAGGGLGVRMLMRAESLPSWLKLPG